MSNSTLDIAIATRRDQEIWSQEQWEWGKIAKRLSTTHRTSESYATYISAPVPRQAEIKDIGGFVGGYLLDGRRSKRTIKHRQLLALDVDFAYPSFFSDFEMWFYGIAACCYSTHKHSSISPRLRLIIPLDRPVSPEEYEAIGRKVGHTLGMKFLDPTTFQAERLMYFPSTSKDGDFYFKEQAGTFLSADAILSEYRDWRNVAEWPLCPTESAVIRSDLKKQQDPCEKDGVVGAFCRTYSISEAITEFLPEQYTEAGEERYTYCEGTTAAGAVVYEDKFLYSHHSTDPCSGKLVNAFDLVCIHKYQGDFSKMNNMARTDPKVIEELGIFKLKDNPIEGDTTWLAKMQVDKKGSYLTTIDNFLLILRNDPNLKGRISYNLFDQLLYITKNGATHEFDEDDDAAALRHYFELTYEIYHAAKAKDAFIVAAKDQSFHPIKDYLNSLKWDGVARLDTLFIDNLGVPDTEYTRAVSRKCLTGAVARIFDPGCKFDYMTVAIGPQGYGKSSLLRDMGKDWFSDTLDSINGKEAYMQIQGVWLMEVAELSSVKKAEVDAVKKFVSAQKDKYRVPFAKSTKTVKRQTVFFGSTNEFAFLKDTTGNRRFWPLVITKKYLPGTINPDPIWAEAVYRYQQGETLFLTDRLEAMAAEQQMNHTEADERAGLIEGYVNMLLPEEWNEMSGWERSRYVNGPDQSKGVKERDRVCAAEIWCELFKNNFAEMTPYNTKFIHNILAGMQGWEKHGNLSYKKYGVQRSYIKTGVYEGARKDKIEDWI